MVVVSDRAQLTSSPALEPGVSRGLAHGGGPLSLAARILPPSLVEGGDPFITCHAERIRRIGGEAFLIWFELALSLSKGAFKQTQKSPPSPKASEGQAPLQTTLTHRIIWYTYGYIRLWELLAISKTRMTPTYKPDFFIILNTSEALIVVTFFLAR